MFCTFWSLVFVALALFIGGMIWDTVVFIQDFRLRKRLKEEAVPDPYEAWQHIIWRKPFRQFVPRLLEVLGFMLLWNVFSLVPQKSAQDQKEYELLLLLLNILAPACMIFVTWINWRQWRRYGGRNKERRT
jgi:hypothetical protein